MRYGFAFALIAGLLFLQPLCTSTYLKLFYDKSPALIQPLPQEGLPIPPSLTWSPSTLTLIERLGPMPLAGVLGWNIALSCLLLYGILRILNPTFRMTTGVDWDRTILSRTYMHTRPLIKAFLIIVSAFLPGMLVWSLLGWLFGERSWVLVLRLALLGAGAWVLLSRDGVASDYETGSFDLPRSRAVLRSQLMRGGFCGALAGLSLLYGPIDPAEPYFDFYRSLGAIGESQWLSLLGWSLAFVCTMAFAWAGILVAFGSPDPGERAAPAEPEPEREAPAEPPYSPTKRWLRTAPYLLLLSLVLLAWNRWQPAWHASRYDYTPRSRMAPHLLLAQKAHLDSASPPAHQALLISGEQVRAGQFDGLSDSGLVASQQNGARIESFLRSRDYKTSLSYPAYGTLVDVEALQWSPEGMVRVALLNLEHLADPLYLDGFLNKLSTCAATPEILRLVNRFSDQIAVTFPDRKSLVRMGDIYGQLGQKERAEGFYRRASLPPSQVVARADEHTMFAEGKISGHLTWNGKPVPGLRIGILPAPSVLRWRGGKTSPSALWGVAASARVGADGRFSMTNVVAGKYFLLVESPPEVKFRAGEIRPVNAPFRIDISFAQKHADLGALNITVPAAGQTTGQTSP